MTDFEKLTGFSVEALAAHPATTAQLDIAGYTSAIHTLLHTKNEHGQNRGSMPQFTLFPPQMAERAVAIHAFYDKSHPLHGMTMALCSFDLYDHPTRWYVVGSGQIIAMECP